MKTELSVFGLDCRHCVEQVRKALQGVTGVRAVAVDLEEGRAGVEHDNSDVEALLQAVRATGYQARLEI